MEPTSGESPVSTGETRGVDGALKALWERARRAGELIATLRHENAALRSSVEQLHVRIHQLEQDLSSRNQLPDPGAGGAQGAVVLGNGERELLVSRVKNLLAKLESYL